MATKRSKAPTFADLVADAEAHPVAPSSAAASPGRFNRDGDLFHPDGTLLRLELADVSADEARVAVVAGADVAYEVCGCGGDGPCHPQWLSPEALADAALTAPALRGRSAPTWIDVWTGSGLRVVFAHGDVLWVGLS